MRYLKPTGTPIEINKKVYYLKFTLDAIDELQDKTQLPMNEIIAMTADKKTQETAVKVIMKFLINEEINDNFEYYSILLLNTYIEQLKYKDMPKQKKTESTEYEFTDIEYWFYIGTTVLGRPSSEVWKMTIGQLGTLYNEHAKYQGWKKEDKEVSMDEAIPI